MLIVLFFLLLFPSFSHAQLDSSFLSDNRPFLEIQPEYPNPGDTVSVTLNDYQSNSFGASIAWYVDGTLRPELNNQRTIGVTASDVGKNTTLRAVLTEPGGSTEVAVRTITPVYLDIIVEPQTHVPESYLGRALPSLGSVVNLTALLNNGSMMGTDHIYTWKINDQVLDGGPVRGRNKISFVTPQGSNFILSLQVTRLDGTIIGKRALTLPSVSPEVVFYEVNSLYGLSSQSLKGSFRLTGSSATLRAEPYFLDSQVYNQPSILEWTINNQESTPSGSNPYEITLERTGYGGTADLGFHVRSTAQLLQGGRGNLEIGI